MKLKLEINANAVKDNAPLRAGSAQIMITPPIGEDFWLARVPVSEAQAIVCFPKFGTIGIGFQHEEDWNTNLPYSCKAEEIYAHIKKNRGDCNISKAQCIEAIAMLQNFAKAAKAAA